MVNLATLSTGSPVRVTATTLRAIKRKMLRMVNGVAVEIE